MFVIRYVNSNEVIRLHALSHCPAKLGVSSAFFKLFKRIDGPWATIPSRSNPPGKVRLGVGGWEDLVTRRSLGWAAQDDGVIEVKEC